MQNITSKQNTQRGSMRITLYRSTFIRAQRDGLRLARKESFSADPALLPSFPIQTSYLQLEDLRQSSGYVNICTKKLMPKPKLSMQRFALVIFHTATM